MTAVRPGVSDKRKTFFQLHQSGCFVIPNPWDVGSARFLQSLGFKALATTSSGFAWSQGRPDCGISLEMALDHLRHIVAATDVPVNADFQNGFAHDPQAVGEHVRQAIATGIAGVSIEDSTGEQARPLYDLDTSVARIRAARSAIDKAGGDVLLVGRAECFVAGRPDLPETLARLKAYAQAGADCLFAPGLRTRDQITAVVAAVAPKPVNLLVGAPGEFTVAQIGALGVRRISVGGALARAAWGAFMLSARAIAQQGSFEALREAPSHGQLDSLFHEPG